MQDVLDRDREGRRRGERRVAEGSERPGAAARGGGASASSARTWPCRASCATPGRATSASTSTWAARSASRWSSRGVTPAVAAREEFATLVKEIAMQIAAASPIYVDARRRAGRRAREGEGDLPRADGELGQAGQRLDKIVEGKLGSFYAQVVLLDQPSIRDPKMTVARRARRGRARRSARRSRSPASRGSRSAKPVGMTGSVAHLRRPSLELASPDL